MMLVTCGICSGKGWAVSGCTVFYLQTQAPTLALTDLSTSRILLSYRLPSPSPLKLYLLWSAVTGLSCAPFNWCLWHKLYVLSSFSALPF